MLCGGIGKMKEPKVIIENGIVINADQLKKYWADYFDKTERIRAGMFRDLRTTEESQPPQPIVRVIHSNMSKQESDLLQQTAGKLEHVSKTLTEHLSHKRVVPPPKHTNGGLKIE
jgi:hypothetical protein